MDITIKNYRCFPLDKPVHVSIKDGFTGLAGLNNSGKSALLKFFYELRGLFASISQRNENFIHALNGHDNFALANTVRDPNELFCNTNNQDISIEIKVDEEPNNKEHEDKPPDKIILNIPRGTNTYHVQIMRDKKYLEGDITKEQILTIRKRSSAIRIGETQVYMEDYYRAFEALSKMVYIGPFRNAINIGGSENYYDMTVGQQFITLWDNYKSGDSKNSIEAALRLTEDIRAIFNFNRLDINASKDNKTLHVIANGKPYKLDELGSGLAQFIVILANIAVKQPSWILIDEPELNLHPSLQIDFLTTLASYSTKGILFSTHNIGLARACADRIYSFRLDNKGRSEVNTLETTPNFSEFLGELSFSGYREMGFDKVLLVEGSTEVKAIQQLLRKYGKDHQIVLLSLGGSDLIKEASELELQEIKRISKNVYSLIDSERETEKSPIPSDRQKFLETCKRVRINCYVLGYRALENYMSDRAVKVVKGTKYRSLEPYEKLAEVSPSWGKQDNWRIAREMTREELSKTDLGKFLSAL